MEKSYFSDALIREIKDRFYYVDTDPQGRSRLFFENSGGSLRLRAAVEAKAEYEKIPDCPERYHDISMQLRAVKEKGIRDIMQIIFGAAEGQGALGAPHRSFQCAEDAPSVYAVHHRGDLLHAESGGGIHHDCLLAGVQR